MVVKDPGKSVPLSHRCAEEKKKTSREINLALQNITVLEQSYRVGFFL